MESENKRAPVERGAGDAVVHWNGRNSITAATLHDAMTRACAEVGIVDRDFPADGRWHKTDINGDPRGRGDGRIKLFPDGEGGIVCNWKGETLPFFVDDGRKLTEAERRDRQRRRAESVRQAQEEHRYTDAASKASAIWNASPPATDDHPYLIRKRVKTHGLHVHNGELVIPMRDGAEELHSLQFIHPEGEKRFLTNGRMAGCYFSIGTMGGAGSLCLCEGHATGASIHEATGYPVAVAFSAGNLGPVAQSLRTRFLNSRLIVCADDDVATDGNPGLTKAREVARAAGGLVAVPDFGEDRDPAWTDFNDLAGHRGMEAVRRAIATAKAPAEQWPEPQSLDREAAQSEPYPLDALPGTIQAAVKEVQGFTKAPMPLVASAALGAVSIATQAHVDVKRAERLSCRSCASPIRASAKRHAMGSLCRRSGNMSKSKPRTRNRN